MQSLYPFNVRVYGILLNDKDEVLLSDEQEYGMRFTKFPGGGLEYGEGLIDGLKREYLEECGVAVNVLRHIYTTDFFERSYFNDSQILSVYYLVDYPGPFHVSFKEKAFDFDGEGEVLQAFRWMPIHLLDDKVLTFDTDKRAFSELLMQLGT
ncbi:NUDIX domain-containing protein [Olivibacter sitiensis]|uniref:NUDIX domain-containing protein n=1 Tax=Olivibacter sitiensis TaxID=376470 RepID=UPI000407342A|nr:NUDIX domain-containing protein [Olivibacter sitiensis]